MKAEKVRVEPSSEGQFTFISSENKVLGRLEFPDPKNESTLMNSKHDHGENYACLFLTVLLHFASPQAMLIPLHSLQKKAASLNTTQRKMAKGHLVGGGDMCRRVMNFW